MVLLPHVLGNLVPWGEHLAEESESTELSLSGPAVSLSFATLGKLLWGSGLDAADLCNYIVVISLSRCHFYTTFKFKSHQ